MTENSILNISVSIFSNYLATHPKEINLLVWLSSKKYSSEVDEIRKSLDDKTKKTLKSKLPAITPSGIFSRRNAKSLVKHSGFIQFDIDRKDNTHINNYSNLKNQIRNIQEVAFCGLSVSGKGYWGLIPISDTTCHKEHFEALLKKFKSLGIVIDKSCKDVSRLRGYSVDEKPYFNHTAQKFHQKIEKQNKRIIPNRRFQTNNSDSIKCNVEKKLNLIQEKRIDITRTYDEWFSICCSIANEFGESGREYFHILSRMNSNYKEPETEKQFNYCLNNNYKYNIATFFHYCKLNNISD